MVMIAGGNRIIGGIGAPGGGMSEAFSTGAASALDRRQTRLGLDVTAQDMRLREDAAKRVATEFGWKVGDRARSEAAFDAYGAPLPSGGGAAPAPGVNVGGMFAPMGTAPAGYRLGAPGQMPMPGVGAGQNLTFGLIQQFEGYRASPYWDVNAHRAGYGSDTVTLSDGSVVPVRPGMTVSRADADRDLTRRLNTEFIPRAASQVGAKVWASLPEHVTAPLVSIAYNYGSLPSNIVEAVKSGDPERIAQAIEARAGDNGGVNAKRRAQEAALVRSGGAVDAGLMRAAAAPTGAAGGSYIPDQSQRFRPADYAAALEVINVQAAPDGSIMPPTAPVGRPGDFAAQGTQDRLAAVQAGEVGLGRIGAPELQIKWAEDALAEAQARYVRNPNGENSAEVVRLIQELRALRPTAEGYMTATKEYTEPRGNLALEGPEATAAGVRTGTSQPTPATTTPATTTPATTTPAATTPTPTAPAQAGLSFGSIAPTGELPLSLGATGAAPPAAEPPAAGVTAPSVTTSDVRAGASVMTDTGEFPGLAALFQDTAMVGQEEAALAAQEQALLRRMEFARQTRDATTMMEADGQLALIQARRVTLGYIKAGNAAMTGNFDPMAEVLSGMAGQTVRITPTGTGTYDVSVDGRVAQSDVDPKFMVQQYLYGVNEAYRTQVDAARAARVAQAAEQAKYAAEQTKIILEQTLQQEREVTVEQAKAIFASQAGANPDLSTQTIQNPDNSTSILLFDKKNPNTPLSVIQLQTNPDGTVETVQTGVVDMRRNQ